MPNGVNLVTSLPFNEENYLSEYKITQPELKVCICCFVIFLFCLIFSSNLLYRSLLKPHCNRRKKAKFTQRKSLVVMPPLQVLMVPIIQMLLLLLPIIRLVHLRRLQLRQKLKLCHFMISIQKSCFYYLVNMTIIVCNNCYCFYFLLLFSYSVYYIIFKIIQCYKKFSSCKEFL